MFPNLKASCADTESSDVLLMQHYYLKDYMCKMGLSVLYYVIQCKQTCYLAQTGLERFYLKTHWVKQTSGSHGTSCGFKEADVWKLHLWLAFYSSRNKTPQLYYNSF